MFSLAQLCLTDLAQLQLAENLPKDFGELPVALVFQVSEVIKERCLVELREKVKLRACYERVKRKREGDIDAYVFKILKAKVQVNHLIQTIHSNPDTPTTLPSLKTLYTQLSDTNDL